MMQFDKIFAVIKKELVDNLRDKRSLFFSLFYGPVLMPILMIVPMMFGVSKFYISQDAQTDVYVDGIERASDLMHFMANNNLVAKAAPDNYKEQIENRDLDLVLSISEEFSSDFRDARPAKVLLFYNSSSKDAQQKLNQVNAVLQQYSETIKQLRMYARGIDASIFSPLFVAQRDLGHSSFDSDYIGFMIYFISIFAMVGGGLYLAVESIAGEREKHTLEPLLSLPLKRFSLLVGKFGSIFCFVLLSFSLAYFVTAVIFLISSQLESTQLVQVNFKTLGLAYIFCIPCLFLFTSTLILISTLTKTTKEAQTYSGMVFFIPMIPVLLEQFLQLEMSPGTAAIPLFSHHQIIMQLFSSKPADLSLLLICCFSTLAISAAFFFLAAKKFASESVLKG